MASTFFPDRYFAGAKDYSKFIRDPYTGVIDILKAFPSCHPPIERLVGMSVSRIPGLTFLCHLQSRSLAML